MAISVLTAGGMGGARPAVGAFFGKPAAANDNAQKVSSNFISKDVIGSVLGNISGISGELKKIQQFSKDAIKSFERLVVDMRKLNNDITGKFKSVNTQIKKDNMDFLRSITRAYGDTLQSTGEMAVNVPETAGKAAGAAAGGAAAAAGGSSVLDTVMGIGSTVADFLSGSKKAVGAAAAKETVKDVAKGAAKPTLSAVVKKAVGGAIGKSVAKAIPGIGLVAGVFAGAMRALDGDFKGATAEVALGAAGLIPGGGTAANIVGNIALLARDIYKEYYGQFPEDDPDAKKKLQEIMNMIQGEISGDVTDTKQTVGGEEIEKGKPLSDKQMLAIEAAVSMGNNNYPDWLMEQYKKQKSEGGSGGAASSKPPDTPLPNFNPADVGKPSVPPEVMRSWKLNFPEMVKSYDSMTDDDKSKVSKLFAEGNNTAAERMVAMRAGIEAAPTEKKLADTGRNITGRNLAATIKGTENDDSKQFAGVADKASAGISAATDETGGKPIKVSEIPPSTPPADVPAEGNTGGAKSTYAQGVYETNSEGYLPESVTSASSASVMKADAGKSERVSTNSIMADRTVEGSATKMNTFAEKGTQVGVMMASSNTENNNGVAELKEMFGERISGGFMKRDTYNVKYKGKDLDLRKTEYFQVRSNVEAGDYPSAFKILDKLALRKDREEFVAKGGKPSEYNATPKAAEIAGENVAGGGGGGGDSGGAGTGGPSGDTGKADGAPEAASASPPNVPADLEPPSEANKNTAPIVMNNESSSSSGSVGGGEADKMSGQNLPLTAQNDALTEYFAKQNINYQ